MELLGRYNRNLFHWGHNVVDKTCFKLNRRNLNIKYWRNTNRSTLRRLATLAR